VQLRPSLRLNEQVRTLRSSPRQDRGPRQVGVGRCHCLGGCDQPASGCEPHHATHRKDGGTTSLTNLKDYCWWHHHVVLHELGWTLTAHPDGTSQVTSPAGKTIRSHSPPPRPG
jgi:hypothetical protein